MTQPDVSERWIHPGAIVVRRAAGWARLEALAIRKIRATDVGHACLTPDPVGAERLAVIELNAEPILVLGTPDELAVLAVVPVIDRAAQRARRRPARALLAGAGAAAAVAPVATGLAVAPPGKASCATVPKVRVARPPPTPKRGKLRRVFVPSTSYFVP